MDVLPWQHAVNRRGAVSLFAARRLSSATCHCHTRCAACDEQGQGECLLGGNESGAGGGGGEGGFHGHMCVFKSFS